MGNKLKHELDPVVSTYLQMPLRDLAEAVAEIEARRAIERELEERLAARQKETPAATTITVHCRSGFHAR